MIVSQRQVKLNRGIKVNTTIMPPVLKALVELSATYGRKYTDEMREAIKQHLLRNNAWPYKGD